MEEEWRAVPGYEGSYEISDLGRVRSLDRGFIDILGRPRRFKGKMLKAFLRKGYPSANLYVNGCGIVHTVHRLVLTAFVGSCPEGMEACHYDANRENNRLSNLRWDTRVGNHQDTMRHGHTLAGARHPKAKLTDAIVAECRARYAIGEKVFWLAKEFGVHWKTMNGAIKRRTWGHVP